MIRLLIFALVLMVSSRALADNVEAVLRLWGAQAGPWVGEIEIYGPGGTGPQTVRLRTKWDAVPDHSTVTKLETFIGPNGDSSSVTLMYAAPDRDTIVTPYFTNGRQRDYYFSVVSVAVTDPLHWTTVIATPDEQEIYEDRPAVLRYVRTRTGNKIENTKEVNFLDDNGDDTFELRSLIRQRLLPEQMTGQAQRNTKTAD